LLSESQLKNIQNTGKNTKKSAMMVSKNPGGGFGGGGATGRF
jgi:hypothetical protein